MSGKYRAELCTAVEPPQHTLLSAMPCPPELPLPMSHLRGAHIAILGAPLVFKNKKNPPKCQTNPPLNDSQLHSSNTQVAERLSPSLTPFLLARLTPILFPCSRRLFCWPQLGWCPARRLCCAPGSTCFCTDLPWPPASSSVQAPWIITAGLL